MNEFLSAGIALVIAASLWGIGKKPKKLFKSNIHEYSYPSEITALIKRTNDSSNQNIDHSIRNNQFIFDLPRTNKERTLFRNNLKKLIAAGPEERLLAIQAASKWGDESVVPILKIGLKDFDSRIVITSAKAISKFKCSPKIVKSKSKSKKSHPLNISLMR